MRDELQRAAFSKAIIKWMHQQGFWVGKDVTDVPEDKQFEALKQLLPVVMTAVGAGPEVGTALKVLATSGATKDEVLKKVSRFTSYADLIGTRIEEAEVQVIPVIYADELAPEHAHDRFERFLELAWGLTGLPGRVGSVGLGQASVYPLLVYFDEQKIDNVFEELIYEGWRKPAGSNVLVRACFLDVTAEEHAWSRPKPYTPGGVWADIRDVFNPQHHQPLKNADRQVILQWAKAR